LVKGAWLHRGQHITAIGADDQTKCELDADCLRRADRLIVDSLESARLHGDVARHLAQGDIQPEQIHGELGSVLSGNLAGRRRDEEITIAKFVGLGVQDLVAAEVSLAKLELHPDSRTRGTLDASNRK
jgi:ornithine cyclodeaminase/alanine dehydrogenase-like protein (mu-crystallin family)